MFNFKVFQELAFYSHATFKAHLLGLLGQHILYPFSTTRLRAIDFLQLESAGADKSFGQIADGKVAEAKSC